MHQGRRNILLIELIIVILFFSLSAVVTLQVFAKAHQRTAQSKLITQALIAAEDWAEQVCVSDDPAAYLGQNGWTSADGASFQHKAFDLIDLTIEIHPEAREAGTYYRMQIQASDTLNGDVLTDMPISRYVPAEEGV